MAALCRSRISFIYCAFYIFLFVWVLTTFNELTECFTVETNVIYGEIPCFFLGFLPN